MQDCGDGLAVTFPATRATAGRIASVPELLCEVGDSSNSDWARRRSEWACAVMQLDVESS
eukprot:COSAG03_NODE_25915_length_262_cov_1.539877_1_plen_59_part_10